MINRIRYKEGYLISPDAVCIPDWGYNSGYTFKDAITLTYANNELYISSTRDFNHFTLPARARNAKDLLEIRLWTESKLITWWQDNIVEVNVVFNEINNILQSNKYTEYKRNTRYSRAPQQSVDSLIDYTFVFREKIGKDIFIVRCSFDELSKFNLSNTDYYNNICERGLHIMSPLNKLSLVQNNLSLQEWRHLYYKEDCKVWTKKIGSMDVAQWRL